MVAQRGDLNGNDVEAEEKVLAKFLALDAFLEAAVGGGDDAHVHFDGAIAAHAFEFPLLQDAQQLGLDLGGDFADFVQQDGAAVGQLEPAFALGDAPVNAPFSWPKNSLSIRFSGMAAQLTLMKGRWPAGFAGRAPAPPVPCPCRFRP